MVALPGMLVQGISDKLGPRPTFLDQGIFRFGLFQQKRGSPAGREGFNGQVDLFLAELYGRRSVVNGIGNAPVWKTVAGGIAIQDKAGQELDRSGVSGDYFQAAGEAPEGVSQ